MQLRNFNKLLLINVSSIACIAGMAATAQAQTAVAIANESTVAAPQSYEIYSNIVVRDDIPIDDPAPGGAYDNAVDVTGVGQMVTQPDLTSFGVGLCTGTLINPRTVIFAAHCVNTATADSYGSPTGGTPISFGFGADNQAARRLWTGFTPGGKVHQTDLSQNLYNVEQVWYDERSLTNGFLEADVALATLDTHADDVPTWVMLFSPLAEATHGVVNGYGTKGNGSTGASMGLDSRRRVAENMISVLGSLDDIFDGIFGPPPNTGLPQSLYQTDFDSPNGEGGYDGITNFDFDAFDGPALPREGTTAGGDSGGPLIADEAYDTPVVTAVLSGGIRYHGAAQPRSSYGGTSFYQPLFLYWDQIVLNNSYVYASSLPGNANWTDPGHWMQDMDPSYAIDVNGDLVNALPGFEAGGISGDTPKFGNACFLTNCLDISTRSVPLVDGGANSIFIEGGPGSTNFVPDNVVADPGNGVRARYYEVTLAAPGKTKLKSDITIDRLNVDGLARLDIKKKGSLKVWGDYTQTGGWVDVDGSLTTGEAFLGTGLLTGSGFFDPTYLTSVAGVIAPGGIGGKGTLTIAGDVILSTASLTFFDVGRGGADKIAVVGDADNSGIISLGGTAAVINKFGRGSARFNQQFEIITADGGVENSFDEVVGRIGVLYPELSYGPNNVVAKMRAIRFRDFLGAGGITNPFSLAFGNALDGARGNSYTDLSNIYGLIDVMEVGQLNATFQGLSATQAGRTTTLDQQQGSAMRSLVSDRLSVLGAKEGVKGKIRIIGAPGVLNNRELTNSTASQISFAGNYQSSNWNAVKLPENMSGFMSAGVNQSALAFSGNGAEDQQGSWHIAMGLEYGLNDRVNIGTAFGYADGVQQIGGSIANVETNQASVYGSYRLGGNFYIGGQASVSYSQIDSSRRLSDGLSGNNLNTNSLTFASEIEAGYNLDVGGITLTPRASVGYSSYAVDGFRDGASELALAVDQISRSGIDAKIGMKISGSTRLGFASGWSFQPEMKFDYVNRLSGNDTNFLVRFLDADSVALALPIGLQDASYGEVKGGFRFTNGRLGIGAAVESRIGQQIYRDDRAVVNMSLRF